MYIVDSIIFIKVLDIVIYLKLLEEEINPSLGKAQGSSIVQILFCYFIDKAIKNREIRIPYSLQLYVDDIIAQVKTIEEINDIYHNLKQEIVKINLSINPEKCEIITDDVNDVIKDRDNDQIIISTKKRKYLGQLINNQELSENTTETKIFGKPLINSKIYNGFSKKNNKKNI